MIQVSQPDVDRQARWEVSAITRGVEEYHRAADKAERQGRAHELPPALMILQKTARGVIDRIEAMRVEAISAEGGEAGGWETTFAGLDAAQLAVIALNTILGSTVVGDRDARVGMTVLAFSRRVMGAIRDQEDFERFRAAQKAAEKTRRKVQRGSPEAVQAARVATLAESVGEARAGNLARLFESVHPNASRHQWARFAKRFGVVRTRAQDDDRDATRVGAALAQALVEGAPEWFTLERAGDGPKLHRSMHVLLTQHAVEQMEDRAAVAELARPAMRPMLIPPRPWAWGEKGAAK